MRGCVIIGLNSRKLSIFQSFFSDFGLNIQKNLFKRQLYLKNLFIFVHIDHSQHLKTNKFKNHIRIT